MRVAVDHGKCESNAVCAAIAPDVFELDDDDLLLVRVERPAEPDWPAVELAARSCPKLAIELVDEG